MMVWFWYFLIYSFFGFVLEVLFARVTHSAKLDRKCFLLLPLCPVYGLGALGILLAAELFAANPLLMAVVGGGAATAAEYLMGLFYEKVLGVSFWDYSHLPINVGGKVCLPFSIIWGILGLGLVYLVHPSIASFAAAIPPIFTPAAVILTLTDGLISMYLLRTTRSTDSLKWYDPEQEIS